jgi:hypothetical protein
LDCPVRNVVVDLVSLARHDESPALSDSLLFLHADSYASGHRESFVGGCTSRGCRPKVSPISRSCIHGNYLIACWGIPMLFYLCVLLKQQ